MVHRGNPITKEVWVKKNPNDVRSQPEPHKKKYTWLCSICNKEYTFKVQATQCQYDCDKKANPAKYVTTQDVQGVFMFIIDYPEPHLTNRINKLNEYISMKGMDFVIDAWEKCFKPFKKYHNTHDDSLTQRRIKFKEIEKRIFGKNLTSFEDDMCLLPTMEMI